MDFDKKNVILNRHCGRCQSYGVGHVCRNALVRNQDGKFMKVRGVIPKLKTCHKWQEHW